MVPEILVTTGAGVQWNLHGSYKNVASFFKTTTMCRRYRLLKTPQPHPAHRVVAPLFQDQMRPLPGGPDVFAQVHQVDRAPDRSCGLERFLGGQRRVAVEVRGGVPEDVVPQG